MSASECLLLLKAPGGDLWRPQSVRQRTMGHQEVPHTISDEKRVLLRIQNDINPQKIIIELKAARMLCLLMGFHKFPFHY